jgi:hypothetical protein
MPPMPHTKSPFAAVAWARALDTWREAASLVTTRWELFRDAEPETRRWAFASYMAALDAEEAAATDMAALSTRIAA